MSNLHGLAALGGRGLAALLGRGLLGRGLLEQAGGHLLGALRARNDLVHEGVAHEGGGGHAIGWGGDGGGGLRATPVPHQPSDDPA